MKVEKGLLYTKDHEWVKVEGEEAYIGLADYAQSNLGDIVYVELPDAGDEIDEIMTTHAMPMTLGDLGIAEPAKAAAALAKDMLGRDMIHHDAEDEERLVGALKTIG